MDLLNKIDKLLSDEITTGDVATNTAKGHVDVIGGKCPNGMVYDKTKKICVPAKNESSVVGATYVSGNSTIAGSGQTRVWGREWNLIDALETKEPVDKKMEDKTKENLERPNLKFDSILGAYIPKKIDIDTSQMENDDE